MHKTILAIAAASLMTGSADARSRDAGPPDRRQVAIGVFDRIAVAGPFVVRVTTGDAADIRLAGPRTMLDDTEMFVRDGELIIRWQEGASWSRNGNHGVDIDITVPSLRGATMAGAGSIEIDKVKAESFAAFLVESGTVTVNAADVGRFRAQLAGSGSLAIGQMAAKALEADLAGSGHMRVAGRAESATLRLMGSGSFNNPGFKAAEATIVSAGSGVVRAEVTNAANVETIGSGAVSLTGGAKCNVSGTGAGNVRCG